MINNPIIYKFLKDFTNRRKKTKKEDLSPTFLNTGTTEKTFQETGKQDSVEHLLKSSSSI